MLSTNWKRHLALVMALAMVLTLVPTQAFATETEVAPDSVLATEGSEPTVQTEALETTEGSEPTIQTEPPEETQASESTAPAQDETSTAVTLASMEAELNAYVERYQLDPAMTDEELANVYIMLGTEESQAAWEKTIALDEKASVLTQDELEVLAETENFVLVSRFFGIMEAIQTPEAVADYECYLSDGKVRVVTQNNKFTSGDNSWYISFTGTGTVFKKSTTVKVTLYNATDIEQNLAFSWAVTGGSGGVIVAGVSSSANSSGSYDKTLASGGSVDISVTSGAGSSSTATISITDVNLYTINTSAITFVYDSDKGTVKKNGSEITSDTIETPTEYVAEPKSGYSFIAWVDEDQRVLSTSASYSAAPEGDRAIQAIFAGSEPWYFVEYSYCYNDWDVAFGIKPIEDNVYATGTYVTLANTATLPARTDAYTIPAGKKFLIPYSASVSTSSALTQAAFAAPDLVNSDETTSNFRTLTIPENTILNCSGEITIDAKQVASSSQYTGHLTGPYGQMILSDGAQLNMLDGSVLRCYGYITGSSAIVRAYSGSTVHELLQVSDWRGGQATSVLHSSLKGESFLISQFYMQNIKSSYEVDYGATAIADAAIQAGMVTKSDYRTEVCLFGVDDGLFLLKEGASIKRTFSTTDGRVTYEVYGSCVLSQISISQNNIVLNSSEYIMNIPSNMSIIVKSNANVEIPYDFKLLPNAVLEIEENATLNLTGTENAGADLILYDYDDWVAGSYTYVGDFYAVKSTPTEKQSSLKADVNASLIVNGVLNVGPYAGVFSTNTTNTDAGNASLSGTGTIKWNGAGNGRTKIVESNGNPSNMFDGSTVSDVTVCQLQAPLAGISSSSSDFTHSMSGNTTYYALSDGFWCNHPWTDATCTSPKTCSVCGETEGSALGHTWTDATCTSPKTCSVCGATEGSALGHAYETKPAQAPTLTAEGWNAYQSCTRCGDHNKQIITVAQIGDTPYTVLSDALNAATVDNTLTLLYSFTDPLTISQEANIDLGETTNTVTAGAGYTQLQTGKIVKVRTVKFKISATNVRAGDSLALSFFVKLTDLDGLDYSEYQGIIRRGKIIEGTPTTLTGTLTFTEYGEYLRFCYSDIAAKEMTDDVTIVICDKDGNPLSEPFTSSVEDYALGALDAYDSKTDSYYATLKTALADMLQYGAAAQTHFGYKTNDAPKLGAYQKYATTTTPSYENTSENINGLKSVSMLAKEKLIFTFYFEITGADANSLTAEATYTNHYGNTVKQELTVDTYEQYFTVDVPGLAIADGRNDITCVVKDSAGNEVAKGKSSVASYAAIVRDVAISTEYPQPLKNVCLALMQFVDSAYAFFHQS